MPTAWPSCLPTCPLCLLLLSPLPPLPGPIRAAPSGKRVPGAGGGGGVEKLSARPKGSSWGNSARDEIGRRARVGVIRPRVVVVEAEQKLWASREQK